MKPPRRKPATPHRLGPTHDAFPLRTVAAMSGLTPDLIRAWEKRHAVVAPIRGARGARLYTSADIAHLRRVARVVGAGRAIGDVAALSPTDLEKLAAQAAPGEQDTRSAAPTAPQYGLATRILERSEHFDSTGVRRLLGDAVVALGVRAFVHELALPLMYRVGTRWAEGDLTIAEEHLLSGALRNLLAGLMQSRTGAGRPIVLATPSGERHEIGLMLLALLALEAGIAVVQLGVDLPAAEIVTAAIDARARVIGLSLVAGENRARAIAEISTIQATLPADMEFWLGGADAGNATASVKSFRGLVLETLEATEIELRRVARGTPA
jgi:MerR family transcriptional regulator, light-induced transcriptional regulator